MSSATTESVDPYHIIAEMYDLEHDDFREDIDLLLTFADIVGDPILEMGCGSGRVAVPLATAGFTVTGLDSSVTMLERARNRSANAHTTERLALYLGDMLDATAAQGGPFGLVIFSLNALMHLESQQAQVTALTNARKALDPRGQINIDVINPTPEYLVSLGSSPKVEGSWTLENGDTVDKWSFRQIDPVQQVISTTLWYDQVRSNGDLSRFRTHFDLRYVHFSELELMLQMAGFTEIRAYGSYEMDPLDESSDRIFLTADVTPGVE